MQDSKSIIAAPSPRTAKNEDGEDGKKISLFKGMKISPAYRAEVRAGLQRDFDQIFDKAINEIDPAVNERDPVAGVA